MVSTTTTTTDPGTVCSPSVCSILSGFREPCAPPVRDGRLLGSHDELVGPGAAFCHDRNFSQGPKLWLHGSENFLPGCKQHHWRTSSAGHEWGGGQQLPLGLLWPEFRYIIILVSRLILSKQQHAGTGLVLATSLLKNE